ncbi:MAG TPA: M56 family metallopeptidase, partial [Bacteroidia bacterium]|nr:M56 family metallopeptidase [Bacteroidia bacterium]
MELHLTNLVPDQLIKALCNTLIHSLWQGLILAAVTGLTIVLTKKASAALRYNLMIGFLVLFSVTTVFTFFTQLHLAEVKKVAHITITTKAQLLQATNVVPIEKPDTILTNCINYFNVHSDTIVLIWFLIICARFMQLAAGLHNTYHIKRTKVLAAGNYWDNKISELSDQLGIKRTVQIMQSGIAKLPMVLGHFKPVILIPIGLLTALSTEEVESILVHELAHIHRRDYLVNLLQNLMEIVFFF